MSETHTSTEDHYEPEFYEICAHVALLVPYRAVLSLDFNAFIHHLGNLEKNEGRKMLGDLHLELLKLMNWIIKHENDESPRLSFSSRAIVKQRRSLIVALCSWSEDTARDYQKLNVRRH